MLIRIFRASFLLLFAVAILGTACEVATEECCICMGPYHSGCSEGDDECIEACAGGTFDCKAVREQDCSDVCDCRDLN